MSGMENQARSKEKPKYWYIAEGLIILLAIVYAVFYLVADIHLVMYPLIAFGLVAVAVEVVMYVQKHYLTMLVNGIFVLIVLLHFISKMYFPA